MSAGLELYKDGVLQQHGVQVLGTPLSSVEATEDREMFADRLKEIGEKLAPSVAAKSISQALEAAEEIGTPMRDHLTKVHRDERPPDENPP